MFKLPTILSLKPFEPGLYFLWKLAYSSRTTLPALISVACMLFNVRMQLEIHFDIRRRGGGGNRHDDNEGLPIEDEDDMMYVDEYTPIHSSDDDDDDSDQSGLDVIYVEEYTLMNTQQNQ